MYTDSIDLCRDDFFGQMLTEWFVTHLPHAQQDAGEFAGWFRGILLAKQTVVSMSQVRGWESRFEASVEDKDCLNAPVILRNLPPDASTLQALFEAWRDNAPYKHGFCSTCPHVCLQLERYPALGCKNTYAIF